MKYMRWSGAAAAAVVLLGLGLGVEADLVGFLISRYLGLKGFLMRRKTTSTALPGLLPRPKIWWVWMNLVQPKSSPV